MAAPTVEVIRKTAERGMEFLTTDAAKWKTERKCASCHQGVMTVWALAEAKNHGYGGSAEALQNAMTWSRDRLVDIDKPQPATGGRPMLSTPALYFALMARCLPSDHTLSASDEQQIALHLEHSQETDGSWTWSHAPAQNRPPPVMESDEVATLLGVLAMEPRGRIDGRQSAAVAAHDKASSWLAKAQASDSTQVAAFRVLGRCSSPESAKMIKADIDRLMRRQNRDGGWGQTKELASDAYATGQALYVLNAAGVKADRPAIQRGIAFLVENQKEDGSWPMTPRAHPGATPFKNPSPIIYYGSAWATMALMRNAPK